MTQSDLPRHADFAAHAARIILDAARAAIAERGLFRLSLSGGKTPETIFAALAGISGDLPWEKVQLTFGDERCVPPDHSDSNYLMARRSLIEPARVPDSSVFRIRGEIEPDAAAREYEAKLAAVAARLGETIYAHDLVLLGLGEDGHTASLFPDSPALTETQRLLMPVIGPKPPPQRISFTFPLINAARRKLFLVTGHGKDAMIDRVLAGDLSLPAAHVTGAEWVLG